MTPSDIALWSLGVLLIVKVIVYIVYKKLSKPSVTIKEGSVEEKVLKNTSTEKEK